MAEGFKRKMLNIVEKLYCVFSVNFLAKISKNWYKFVMENISKKEKIYEIIRI